MHAKTGERLETLTFAAHRSFHTCKSMRDSFHAITYLKKKKNNKISTFLKHFSQNTSKKASAFSSLNITGSDNNGCKSDFIRFFLQVKKRDIPY